MNFDAFKSQVLGLVTRFVTENIDTRLEDLTPADRIRQFDGPVSNAIAQSVAEVFPSSSITTWGDEIIDAIVDKIATIASNAGYSTEGLVDNLGEFLFQNIDSGDLGAFYNRLDTNPEQIASIQREANSTPEITTETPDVPDATPTQTSVGSDNANILNSYSSRNLEEFGEFLEGYDINVSKYQGLVDYINRSDAISISVREDMISYLKYAVDNDILTLSLRTDDVVSVATSPRNSPRYKGIYDKFDIDVDKFNVNNNPTTDDGIYFKKIEERFFEILKRYSKDNKHSIVFRGLDPNTERPAFMDEEGGFLEDENQIKRQNSIRDVEKNVLNNTTGNITHDLIIFPEDKDALKIRVAEFLDGRFENLTDIRFKQYGEDGPLLTTNKQNHRKMGSILQNAKYNSEVAAALDTVLEGGDYSFEIIGQMKSPVQGDYTNMAVHWKGFPDYIKKILAKPFGERYTTLEKKPSYVLALTYQDVNGKKHILSFFESDSAYARQYENSIRSNRDILGQRSASITTNFLSTHPGSVTGYYPNVISPSEYSIFTGESTMSLAEKVKKAGVIKSQEWFHGLLTVADADFVILTNSPINDRVANLYQNGGFIFTGEYFTELDVDTKFTNWSHSSMVRYPGPLWKKVDEWKTRRVGGEFKVRLPRVIQSLWGSPLDGTDAEFAIKPKQTNILKSPRHVSMLNLLASVDLENLTDVKRSKLNQELLYIATGRKNIGGNPMIKFLSDNYDNPEKLEKIKYFGKKDDIYGLFDALSYEVDPQMFAQLLMRTEAMVTSTGLNPMEDVTELQNIFENLGLVYTNDLVVHSQLDDTGIIKTGSLNNFMDNNGEAMYYFLEDLIETYPSDTMRESNLNMFTRESLLSQIDGLAGSEANIQTQGILQWVDSRFGQAAETTTPETTTPDTTTSPSTRGSTITDSRPVTQLLNQDNLSERAVLARISEGNINILDAEAGAFSIYDMFEDLDPLFENQGWYRNQLLGDGQLAVLSSIYFNNEDIFGTELNQAFRKINGGSFQDKVILSDKAKHYFTRSAETLFNESDLFGGADRNLLVVEIEHVGTRQTLSDRFGPKDYFEVGFIYDVENTNGDLTLTKHYATIEVTNHLDVNNNVVASITSNVQSTKTGSGITTNIINRSFIHMMKELGIEVRDGFSGQERDNPISSRIHPTGRVGAAFNVAYESNDGSLRLRASDNFLYINRKTSNEEIQNRQFVIDEELEMVRNTSSETRTPRDISPQPVFSQANITPPIEAFASNEGIDVQKLNTALDNLYDMVDNRTVGAVKINLRGPSPIDGTTRPEIEIIKRTGQEPIFNVTAPDSSTTPVNLSRQQLRDIPSNFIVGDITIIAPDEHFQNGIIETNLNNILDYDISIEELYPNNAPRYDAVVNPVQPVVYGNETIDSVRASYTYGRAVGGSNNIGYYGIPYNQERVPTGLTPDVATLRKMMKSFAQSKVGKALGVGWKTLDIGETLINKAFSKAATVAAAAGAITLGTGVATAAAIWSFYEIFNLLGTAALSLPELYQVYARRNEILANGEEWEKQLVEETFWQDYGGELLEMLEEAGSRSPAELLGNAIWSTAIDVMTRASNGDALEESYIEDVGDIDMRNDIYYSNIPDSQKLDLMQNSIDYDKVFTGYLNNNPSANVIIDRTVKLANNVYNRDD